MTEELNTATEVEEEYEEILPPYRYEVGASLVGPTGILLITVYLILASILLLYGFVQFWPPTTPAGEWASTTSYVTFLFWTYTLSGEIRLFIVVAIAGALGGLVHALRSLYWHVGNRELVMSWVPMYILYPFIGAILGLFSYLAVAGGLLAILLPELTVQQTSPYGFAALAGLVGMLSEQVTLKLKEKAETRLALPQAGKDYLLEAEEQGEGGLSGQ